MANSTTTLDLIASAQAGKENTANALFDAGSPATTFGRRASTCIALTWGYYGGAVMVGTTPTQIANGSLTLTASQTNYIESTNATGAVTVNTSGWTGGGAKTPLYSVVTGVSGVGSYQDFRQLQGPAGTAGASGADGTGGVQFIPVACSDEATALAVAASLVTFRMPHAFTLTAIRASLTTAQTSGSIFTVDVKSGGASVFSTKPTLDNTEKTTFTAATASVLSTTALADDAEITIDITQVGDGTAMGLKVYLIGTVP